MQIDYNKKLGEGKYGVVYKGFVKQTEVAVKKLTSKLTRKDLLALLREVDFMRFFFFLSSAHTQRVCASALAQHSFLTVRLLQPKSAPEHPSVHEDLHRSGEFAYHHRVHAQRQREGLHRDSPEYVAV